MDTFDKYIDLIENKHQEINDGFILDIKDLDELDVIKFLMVFELYKPTNWVGIYRTVKSIVNYFSLDIEIYPELDNFYLEVNDNVALIKYCNKNDSQQKTFILNNTYEKYWLTRKLSSILSGAFNYRKKNFKFMVGALDDLIKWNWIECDPCPDDKSGNTHRTLIEEIK